MRERKFSEEQIGSAGALLEKYEALQYGMSAGASTDALVDESLQALNQLEKNS